MVKRVKIITIVAGTLLIAGVAFGCVKVFLPAISSYRQAEELTGHMQEQLLAVTADFTGRFSFMVADLGNPFFSVARESEKECVAASLIKVPLLAVTFRAVEEGRIGLDDEFTIEKRDITAGSGVLKKEKLPKKITLRQLLKLMITRSDNTASNKIIATLGFEYINYTFQELGLNHTTLNRRIMDLTARRKGLENYVSCRDLVYLFEKIYRKELVGARSSEMMLSFLKAQKMNDRIPKYLPQDLMIAHKTGLEKASVGDAGIVFSECSDYVLCVIAQDFPSYRTAKDFIAKISLAVYNSYKQLFNRDKKLRLSSSVL